MCSRVVVVPQQGNLAKSLLAALNIPHLCRPKSTFSLKVVESRRVMSIVRLGVYFGGGSFVQKTNSKSNFDLIYKSQGNLANRFSSLSPVAVKDARRKVAVYINLQHAICYMVNIYSQSV